jgi:hypothetical protein
MIQQVLCRQPKPAARCLSQRGRAGCGHPVLAQTAGYEDTRNRQNSSCITGENTSREFDKNAETTGITCRWREKTPDEWIIGTACTRTRSSLVRRLEKPPGKSRSVQDGTIAWIRSSTRTSPVNSSSLNMSILTRSFPARGPAYSAARASQDCPPDELRKNIVHQCQSSQSLSCTHRVFWHIPPLGSEPFTSRMIAAPGRTALTTQSAREATRKGFPSPATRQDCDYRPGFIES